MLVTVSSGRSLGRLVSLRKNRQGIEAGEGPLPPMGFSLSRKAVAAFMLDVIEKKDLRKIVGIAK